LTLHLERNEMELFLLVHVVFVVGFLGLADVRNQGNRLWEIQVYSREEVSIHRLLEVPIHSHWPHLLGLVFLVPCAFCQLVSILGSFGMYLFENNLLAPPSSCDGEPAPDRVFPAILLADNPNGDFKGFDASMGEVLAVEFPERGGFPKGCGSWPRVG